MADSQPKEGEKIWIRQLEDGSYQWQPREGYGNPSEDLWINASSYDADIADAANDPTIDLLT